MLGPVQPTTGALRPLGIDQVRISGGFWGERQAVVAEATLPHCQEWVEKAGWVENLRAAGAGTLDPDSRTGMIFADSDVYKLVEAMAWESARRGGDPELDAQIDELAAIFAAAQEEDGYLHTGFGRPGQPTRYRNLEWGHELYCYGHLIQAAVARLRGRRAQAGAESGRGGGEDPLVRVALRAADHVCDTFADEGTGVCGHPEIEMALVELYRCTGQRRYLEQARQFVARRGHGSLADGHMSRTYYQDDVPVRQARVFAGHAVRALYLACGAVDVAVETGDAELLAAVVAQWERTVAARTYLTGGMGSRSEGEAFGDDFELPPDGAYAETCAAIASVMLCWRLALATGEVRYADLAERTLFNAVTVGHARHGRAFFYRNPLQQRVPGIAPAVDALSPRAAASLRAPWFECSCCPTNIARTFASLGGYFATVDGEGLQLHQYAAGTVSADYAGGQIQLAVDTGYPWTGEVALRVTGAPAVPWTLSLRVPAWAAGAELTGVAGTRSVQAGWLRLHRTWQPGDEVRLRLPVEPRWTRPDPGIDAVRGQVALERGPLVYCAESTDGSAPSLSRVEVPTGGIPVESAADDLGPGAVMLRVPARVRAAQEAGWPYLPDSANAGGPAGGESSELALIPYHLWAHRGPATMRVWLPAGPTQAGRS